MGLRSAAVVGSLMLTWGLSFQPQAAPRTPGSTEDHRLLPAEPVSVCATSHVEKLMEMSTGDPRVTYM